MQQFYTPKLHTESESFQLSESESKHLIKVLRKTEGDQITLTNGKGFRATGTIIVAHPKKTIISITNKEPIEKLKYTLDIAFAPTKNNDRTEWFIEKATELGIRSFLPIQTFHSERKQIKINRFQTIIENAAKQSLKNHFPSLNPLVKFNDFIQQDFSTYDAVFIAYCRTEFPKKELKKSLNNLSNILILIGPEGDFSLQEIKAGIEKGFIPCTLGEERLRTETAALHAVSIIHTIIY